jgi:DnaJ family protein C protein 11
LKAYYGRIEEEEDVDSISEKLPDNEGIIDVTIPVQSFVLNSELRIMGGRSKANLIGFYDPCIGESKRLVIKYMFKGRTHQLCVDDKAHLSAPLRGKLYLCPLSWLNNDHGFRTFDLRSYHIMGLHILIK